MKDEDWTRSPARGGVHQGHRTDHETRPASSSREGTLGPGPALPRQGWYHCHRRIRKTDNNRIARVCGATIVNRIEEIQDTDIGTAAGLFEVRKIGDEYFSFIEECKDPKACTILLRGVKDVYEIERNLQDAMQTARNVLTEPMLLPGGGAVEMHVARAERHAPTSPALLSGPSPPSATPSRLSRTCARTVVVTSCALCQAAIPPR